MIETSLLTDGARRSTPPVELLWSPARPALQVSSGLDQVRRAPTLLEAMRSVGPLLSTVDAAIASGAEDATLLEPIIEAIDDATDTLTALAAVHALARVPGSRAKMRLSELVSDAVPGFEQHALWALSDRPTPTVLAMPVARAVARGGLAGMHAQQTLATWARSDPRFVLATLRAVLDESEGAAARRYLTETIGLLPGRLASSLLERVASDKNELLSVRKTAIAAFSDRLSTPEPSSFRSLAGADQELGTAVRRMRAHRALLRRGLMHREGARGGLRAMQVHLGETGGLATLLPSLGEALAGQRRVAEAITVVRARPGLERPVLEHGHRLEMLPLEGGEGAGFSSRWPAVVAAERGIRAAVLAGMAPHVIHLRMADPGTYAAARVARSMGIATVFTLAPDPHGPVAADEQAGVLDRTTFASEDGRQSYWFRAALVEHLAREARELVLFPRENLRDRIEGLTGVSLSSGRPRHTVVAEGIDTSRSDRAAATVEAQSRDARVLADLRDAISDLPPERHELPIVVSAGRLVELKGMARLVQAFALDARLAARANLVIVGGNLTDPSASESAELSRIRGLFEQHPGLEHRVVLLGQRDQDEVALVFAAARHGWSEVIPPGGSYACGSAKEEFGLAIVEAMAAGLPVTAPLAGGPGTYIDHGRTGALVDTSDPAALAQGILDTLDLAVAPETAARARAIVDERYTLERMARTLTAIYRVTAGASSLATRVTRTGAAA